MDGYSILISLTLRMTIIILCILAIKTLLRSRLSPKIHCALWLIVCVQFIFCIFNVRIQNEASIYNVVPTINAVHATGGIKREAVLTAVWLTGAALSGIWCVGTYAFYRRGLKRCRVVCDKSIENTASRIRAMLNIPNTEKIVIRYGETAQALPHAVIIPNGFSESEEYQILLHELCHYRHKDYLKLWAGLLILCVNWFNPLVWYAFKLFRTDLEMLCDDRVLSVTDNKKEYARVLVKSAAVRSRFVPGAASVHNGKSEVGKRVKRIASLRRYKPVWLFICGLVCVTVCCVCLTDAVTVAVENTMDIVPQITDSANQGEDEALTQPTADENEYASQSGGEAVMQSASLQTASDKSKANAVKINQAESDMQAPRTVEGSYEEAAQSKSENASEGISNDSGDAVQAETDEFTDTESNDLVPNIGSARDDVYSSLGEPESVSSGGSKETYQLDDGSTAVLQYSGDTLDAGYIVN